MDDCFQLHTSRLLIRPFANEDLDAMCRWTADAEVMKFIGGVLSRDETSERLSRIIAVFEQMSPLGPRAISLSAVPNQAIGYCGLGVLPHSPEKHIEIFAGLTRSAWGGGYAAEACQCLMRIGFKQMGLDRIVAAVNPKNERSLRLVDRLGFAQVGTMPWPQQDIVGVYAIERQQFCQ